MSRSPVGAILAIVLTGCATESAYQARGAAQAPEPVPELGSYEGWEGFGKVRWGMSLDQAVPLLPGAKSLAQNVLVRNEMVDERLATVRYFFWGDRLARVTVAFSPEASAEADVVLAHLQRDLGKPAQSHDPRQHSDSGDILAVAGIVVAVAAIVGVAAYLSGKGSSGSGGSVGHGAGGVHAATPGASAHLSAPHAVSGSPTGIANPFIPPDNWTAHWHGWLDVTGEDFVAYPYALVQFADEAAAPPDPAVVFSRWTTKETEIQYESRVSEPRTLFVSYESRVVMWHARNPR